MANISNMWLLIAFAVVGVFFVSLAWLIGWLIDPKKSPPSEASPTPKHGVPALISFFIPGVGQLIKGNIFRALFIWIWLGAGGGFAAIAMLSNDTQVVGVLLLLSLPFVYLWNLVDAYNH